LTVDFSPFSVFSTIFSEVFFAGADELALGQPVTVARRAAEAKSARSFFMVIMPFDEGVWEARIPGR
jgi:hypothetical protein